ncbi:MAG: PaaI family thioesterase [Firmicutes bacterium]|nr:PaaI family thioesterase [Bacillota bacterium]
MTKEEMLAELGDFGDDELRVALHAGRALKAARDQQFYFLHSFFRETFDMERWEETGECVVAMPQDELVWNPGGMVHWGVLAFLCDNAMGLASHLASGRPGVTVDLGVKYHKPARGKILRATASVLSCGSTLVAARCQIHDERGTLVASGTGTFYHRRAREGSGTADTLSDKLT